MKTRLLLLPVLCLCMYVACIKKPRPDRDKTKAPPHKEGQLIIWGGDAELRQSLRDSILLVTGNTDPIDVELCLSCDGQLELWSGEAIRLFGSETVRGGTKSKLTASGTETVYYSLNFDLNFPFNKEFLGQWQFRVPPLVLQGTGEKSITVAVFDSGLDPEITVSRDAATCIEDGKNGWNVMAGNADIKDDFPSRHGTVVTGYIYEPGVKELDILPVKVLDSNGASSLFKLLCGMAFAANSGADIINTSLGFYYYEAQAPYLLVDYIEQMLTKKGILLVTAAGNMDPDADNRAMSVFGLSGSDLRNIDKHYFLPGSLSEQLENIICVTTVNQPGPLAINSTQNYSKNKVSIGVMADSTIPGAGYGVFKHPFEDRYIDGSSFATPKMTNAVALWLIKNGYFDAPFYRDDILNSMRNEGFIDASGDLVDYIKNGYLLDHVNH